METLWRAYWNSFLNKNFSWAYKTPEQQLQELERARASAQAEADARSKAEAQARADEANRNAVQESIAQTEQVVDEPTLTSRLWDAWEWFTRSISDTTQNSDLNFGAKVISWGWAVWRLIWEWVSSAVIEWLDMITPDALVKYAKDKWMEWVQAIASTNAWKALIENWKEALKIWWDVWNSFEQSNPNIAASLKWVAWIAEWVATVYWVGAAWNVAKAGAKWAIDLIKTWVEKWKLKMWFGEYKTSDELFKDYEKAIRPTKGWKTASNTQLQTSKQKAAEAVETINDYVKQNKWFDVKDLEWNITRKENIEDLSDMAFALDATKKQLFKQYDDIARQNWNSVIFAKQDFIDELNAMKSEVKNTISDNSPQALERIDLYIKRFNESWDLDISTLQSLKEDINNELASAFKKWDFNGWDAVKRKLWTLIWNKLDETLESIAEGSWKEYSSLKRKYWAVKSIEKDVMSRNVVSWRQSPVSLSDLISNPTAIATTFATWEPLSGIAIYALKEFMKNQSNPNVMVKKMFERLNKAWKALEVKEATPVKKVKMISKWDAIKTWVAWWIVMTNNNNNKQK